MLHATTTTTTKALVVPAWSKLSLVTRVITDGAVLNLPHPVVRHRRDNDTQLWFTRYRLIYVDSHKLRTSQLVCRELRQTSTVNLTHTTVGFLISMIIIIIIIICNVNVNNKFIERKGTKVSIALECRLQY